MTEKWLEHLFFPTIALEVIRFGLFSYADIFFTGRAGMSSYVMTKYACVTRRISRTKLIPDRRPVVLHGIFRGLAHSSN